METQKVVKYVAYMNEYECVHEWLQNRPEKTKETYANNLRRFCDFVNVTPERAQKEDKTKEQKHEETKTAETTKTKDTKKAESKNGKAVSKT